MAFEFDESGNLVSGATGFDFDEDGNPIGAQKPSRTLGFVDDAINAVTPKNDIDRSRIINPIPEPLSPEREAFKQQAREKYGVEGAGTAKRYLLSGLADVGSTVGGTLDYIGKKVDSQSLQSAAQLAKDQADAIRPENQTFGEKIAGGAGSMLGLMATAAPISIAAGVAPVVAGVAGVAAALPRIGRVLELARKFSPAVAAGAMESAAEATSTYDRVLQKTGNAEYAQEQADKTFLTNLPLTIGLDAASGLFKAADQVVKGGWKQGAATVAKATGAEAGQEASQSIVGNAFSGDPYGEGVGEAAALGGIVGGGVRTAQYGKEQLIDSIRRIGTNQPAPDQAALLAADAEVTGTVPGFEAAKGEFDTMATQPTLEEQNDAKIREIMAQDEEQQAIESRPFQDRSDRALAHFIAEAQLRARRDGGLSVEDARLVARAKYELQQREQTPVVTQALAVADTFTPRTGSGLTVEPATPNPNAQIITGAETSPAGEPIIAPERALTQPILELADIVANSENPDQVMAMLEPRERAAVQVALRARDESVSAGLAQEPASRQIVPDLTNTLTQDRERRSGAVAAADEANTEITNSGGVRYSTNRNADGTQTTQAQQGQPQTEIERLFGPGTLDRDTGIVPIAGERIGVGSRVAIRALSRLFGTKVKFYFNPAASDGSFVTPKRGADGVLYINTASGTTLLQVAGHEHGHRMRTMMPEQWAKMKDAYLATLPNRDAAFKRFVADYFGRPEHAAAKAMIEKLGFDAEITDPATRAALNLTEDHRTIGDFITEELVSDLNGKHWGSKEFWKATFDALADKYSPRVAKAKVKALADATIEMIDKLIKAGRVAGQQEFSTIDQDQLEKTRKVVAKAHADWIAENRGKTSSLKEEAEQMRANRDERQAPTQAADIADLERQEFPDVRETKARVKDGRIRRSVNELVQAAESQSDWKTWYARHEDTLIKIFGGDADLFQKILSATSQATGVKGNVSLALKAYDQMLSGKPFDGFLPAVIKNLQRIKENEMLRGAKISQYGEANDGNTEAIAVDRHIAMLFFNTKTPSRLQIESAKKRIRVIADRLGWEPRQVQAALWAYNQVRLGTDPSKVQSYDTILEARSNEIAALRSKLGRGEAGGVRADGRSDEGAAGRSAGTEGVGRYPEEVRLSHARASQKVDPDKVPVFRFKDFIGRDMFATIADRTAAGGYYTGIDGAKVDPIKLHGGPGFPELLSNFENGVVWANDGKGIQSQKERLVAKHGRPLMAVSLGMFDMHKSNATAVSAYMKTLEAYVDQGRIDVEKADAVTESIRKYKLAKEYKKDELASFPGFADKAALHEFIRNASFGARAGMVEVLSKAAAQKLGVPSADKVIRKLADPEYAGSRHFDTVLILEPAEDEAFIKLGENGTEEHPSYAYGIKGKVVGKLPVPINAREIWADWFEAKYQEKLEEKQLFQDVHLGKKPFSAIKDSVKREDYRTKGLWTQAWKLLESQFETTDKAKLVAGDFDSLISLERSFGMSMPVVNITPELADRLDAIESGPKISAATAQAATDFIDGTWATSDEAVNRGGVKPTEFSRELAQSEYSATLTQYSGDELKKAVKAGTMRLFQLGGNHDNGGNRIFFALKKGAPDLYGLDSLPGVTDNEVSLVSVVNNQPGVKGVAGPAILTKAIEEGATFLDCFAHVSEKHPDGFLPTLYGEYGFEPVGVQKFDETYLTDDHKYAWSLDGWKEGDPLPNIVFMKWKGKESDRAGIVQRYIEQGAKSLPGFSSSGTAKALAGEAFRSSAGKKRTKSGAGNRDRGDQGGAGESLASRAHETVRAVQGLTEDQRRNLGIIRRSNARSSESDRAGAQGEGRPSYGRGREGAVQATGVHYSKAQRGELSSRYFGTGMKGEEGPRISYAKDERIKNRLYFYINTGRGVVPESDVGAHAHTVDLQNLYDLDSDPLELYPRSDPTKDQRDQPTADERMNSFESKVIDAGFDGYLTRDFGTGGAVVLLGDHSVPVQYEGAGVKPDAQAFSEPVTLRGWRELQDKVTKNNSLPNGSMMGSDWKRLMPKLMPEVDVSHLPDDRRFYKDQLVKRPEARMSFKRVDTESAEFKRWFGDSKVVDAEGKPLVVYHGTAADFTAFDKSLLGSATDHPASGLGFQFTTNKEAATEYAEISGGEKVMEVFLSIKKPKRYTTKQFLRVLDDLEEGNDSASDLQARLMARGFDGIIAVGDEYDGTHYIAFSPTQIKSAISNTGAFSDTNPDIRYSTRRTPTYTEPQAFVDAALPGLMQQNITIDGKPVGFVSLKSENGKPKILAHIEIFDSERGNGYAEDVIADLLGKTDELWIYNIQPDSVPFWKKMGVTLDEYEDWNHGNGTVNEGTYRANAEERGQAGQEAGDERQAGADAGRGLAEEGGDLDFTKARFSLSRAEMRDYLLGPVVTEVKRGTIAAKDGERASDAAYRWLNEHPQAPFEREDIGEIVFDRNGLENSLQHKFGWQKLNAVAAIPEVLHKGIVIDASSDATGKPLLHTLLAAPISIDGERYQMVIRLRQDSRGTNPHRFYVHEVVLEKAVAAPIKTGAEPIEGLGRTGGRDHIHRILQDILNFKEAKNSFKRVDTNSPEFSDTNPDIRYSTNRNSLGSLTPAQEQALKNVGGITQPKTIAERLADMMKINIRQGLVDQFAPIKDLDQRAYMMSRLSKGGDGTLEAAMLYGKPYIDGDNYNVKIEPEGGFAKVLASLKGEHDRFLWWIAAQRAQSIKDRHDKAERDLATVRAALQAMRGQKPKHMVVFNGSDLQEFDSLVDARSFIDDEVQKYGRNKKEFSIRSIDVDTYNAQLETLTALRDRLKDQVLVDERLFSGADISALKTLAAGNFADGSSRSTAFLRARQQLNEYNNAVLEVAREAGLVDQAAVDILKDQPYVPFYRVMDDGDMPAGRMSGGMLNQRAWNKLKGGKEKLNEDLLANMLMNWSHIYTASLRNRASVATLAAAKRAGAATEVATGTKGSVKVMVNGKQKAYMLDDPHIAEALMALEWAMPGWMRPLAEFKRMFTFGVTVSPFFKVKNLIRDSISAVGQSDLSPNVLKNWKNGWSGTSKDSQVFASMLAGGGVIRFGTSVEDNRAKYARRTIEKIEDHILDKNGFMKLAHKARDVFDWYQENGDRSENINRAALYQAMIDKGYSHTEASFMSRDLLDFSMSGRWPVVRFLAQTVPFLNARLQGLYKLGRAGVENPQRLSAVVGSVVLASLAFMAMADFGDDEDWRKREDWDRDTYWWFKIGKTAFRIPKPFEIGTIGTMAERTAELFFNKEADKWQRYRDSISRALFQTFAFDPTPVIVKPLIEIDANKDSFMKRPIETMAMQRLQPKDRSTDRTSQTADLLGQVGIPNPLALLKGEWKDMSPVQIDHLIRGYFGWAGGVATGMADILLRPAMGKGSLPDRDWLDWSSGKMVDEIGKADSNRYTTAYYAAMREASEAKASYDAAVKAGDKDRAADVKEDNKDQLDNYRKLHVIEARIGYLSRQAKKIQSDKTISAEEKRARIDRINAEKAKIAERAVIQTR